MSGYKVIVSKQVAGKLLLYIDFISRVSVEAARSFVSEYEKTLIRLEDNQDE